MVWGESHATFFSLEILGLLSSGFSYEEHNLLPPPSPAPNLAGERGPGSGLDC